jgi:hypothetical protein
MSLERWARIMGINKGMIVSQKGHQRERKKKKRDDGIHQAL